MTTCVNGELTGTHRRTIERAVSDPTSLLTPKLGVGVEKSPFQIEDKRLEIDKNVDRAHDKPMSASAVMHRKTVQLSSKTQMSERRMFV